MSLRRSAQSRSSSSSSSSSSPVGKCRLLNRLAPAVNAVVENLEGRQLLASDPLAYVNVTQPLPYVLEFNQPVGGLHDKDGEDIGLTRVQFNRDGLDASYLPANLDLRTDLGVLQVTTTGTSAAGGNFNNDNTLTNGVETQFDATTSNWSVTARLKGPLDFLSSPSRQGGVMFGPDQDNYVKLVAVSQPEGQRIQFVDEQTTGTTFTHALGTAGVKVDVGSFAAINTLDLKLVGDGVGGRVQAFYAVNGGAYVKMPQDLFLSGAKKGAFFNAAGRAGLIAMHKNDAGPVTVSFDRFEIQPGTAASARPSVVSTSPANNETGVSRDAFLRAVLQLPNGGVRTDTLTGDHVRLYRVAADGTRTAVQADVGTSGGGDTILVTPAGLLDANTKYTVEFTDGVLDVSGAAFVPFATTFTTGTAGAETDPTLAFERVNLPTATGENFTSLKIGPDGKLYASTIEGKILRFAINADGTLGTPQTITTLQAAFGGGKRMLTGFTFDPAATAANPMIWVSHSQYRLGLDPNSSDPEQRYGDDWTGMISRISSKNNDGALDTVWNVVSGLPRSIRDHLTNQPSFGPVEQDGKRYLYFAQGASSSMGAPDEIWGNRSEHLLTAAILRFDPSAVAPGTTLNVKTEDGGTYNPFAPNAPLQLYATGVRNAYDLVWTRDGKLYAPTNGSAAGGAAPATPALPIAGSVRIDGDDDGNPANGQYSGPAVPGIAYTNDEQHDFLFRIDRGGYYGHPNPKRYEFAAGAGYTPADGVGPAEVTDYAAVAGGKAVQPDRNYRGYAFDFGISASPDGAIEYQNATAFGGSLRGKLLVTRFSGPNDIVVLTRGADGKIAAEQKGIAGLRGLADPLDLVENPANGFLYIAEFSQNDPTKRRITLARPIAPGANLATDKPRLVFNDIRAGAVGGTGSSPAQKLRITNTGTAPLSFPADGFTIVRDPAAGGDFTARFAITNLSSLPDSVAPGEGFDVTVTYTASAAALQTAILRIKSNDASQMTTDVPLRGVGTNSDGNGNVGGTNEPSLQRILNAHQIPVNVGDGDGEATSDYVPSAASEEVKMPRLRRAGAGPVTVEPLAVLGVKIEPVVRIGTYSPGTKDAKSELFAVHQADQASLNPTFDGTTSFDPAGDFGLYGIFPGNGFESNGLSREVFTEDTFNTWEPDATKRTKVRFFPLKNPDGTTVPNAYVFAFEEFFGSTPSSYDSNDVVGIIRNVTAAPAGPEVGLENLDGSPGAPGAPAPDRLVFSRIERQPPAVRHRADGTTFQPPNNRVHDQAKVRVRNTGTSTLTITGAPTLTGAFQLLTSVPAGTTIAPGGSLDLTVKFVATSGGYQTGTLKLNTNDADEPVTTIQLAGYWQIASEDSGGASVEPSLQTVLTAFGYGTKVVKPGEVLNQGGRIRRVGDEVLSPYWKAVDSSRSVSVRQLTAFHSQGSVASLYWFAQGGSSSLLFVHDEVEGQTFLPHVNNSTNDSSLYAAGNFKPGNNVAFGFRVDSEYSDPAKNNKPNASDEGHHVRFWVARDQGGRIIPNAYIMSMDYAGINYDYNDNTYLITNVRPVSPPGAPTGLTATASGAGVALNWNDNTEANLAGYNVYRAASATGTFSKLNTNGLVASSDYNDVFAPAGVTSYYRVEAVDNVGNVSAVSATVSASRSTDTTPPAAPTALTATGSTSGIAVNWADNTEGDLAGYNVLRAASASGPFTKVNGSLLSGSFFNDVAAPAGATSYYQVVAVDKAGNVSPAATANATRPAAGAAPAAPQNLSASAAASGDRVNLGWSASTGADSYRVERRIVGDPNAQFVEIATFLTGTTFADTGVTPSTTYEYRVRAQNANGLSPYSTVATASTPAPTLPDAPTGLTGNAASSNQVDLSWDAAAGAAKYRVRRRLAGGSDPFADVAMSVTTTSYSDTTVAPETAYEYQVLAENVAGLSGPSNVFAVTTPAPTAPAAPTGLGATAVSSSQINLSWAAAVGATRYRLQRRTAGGAFADIASSLTATSYQDKGLDAATAYDYRVIAENDVGPSGPSNVASATTRPAQQPVVYAGQDVGAPPFAGSTVSAGPGAFDVTGSGSDVSNSADQFHFAQRQLTGDFDIKVRVASVTAASSWTKVGLMARESLAANARNAFILATPGANGERFTYRGNAGGATTITGSGAVSYPNTWLRLVRQGDVFTGYRSTDGVNWAAVGSGTVAMPATVYFGMAVTSHNTTASATAQFRDLSDAPAGPVLPLPGAPANASAAAASATVVNLSWSAGSDAASYRIERRVAGAGGFAEIASGVTGTSYQDATASAGTSYEYRVRSENATGLSGYSNVATASTPQVPPAAPTGLAAQAASSSQINLNWNAAAGATSYRLQRRTAGGTFGDVATSLTATSYQDAGLDAGTTYEYRLFAENAAGPSPASNLASATTQNATQPAAYAGQDVGAPPFAGATVAVGSGAFDVTGSGADVINSSDQFHFANRQLTGDFDVKVRVASVTAASSWTKVGLMARETLAANSRNAFILATPGSNGERFSYRGNTGGATTITGAGAVSYPNTWLRLVRQGDVFTGYRSTDGVNWTAVGSGTIAMPATVYFGMAVTSHNTTASATAQFRDLSDNGGGGPVVVPPAAPASLAADAVSFSQINLTWGAVSGATGYRLQRRTAGGVFGDVAVNLTATGYQDTGLDAATAYEYRVFAENAAGPSGASNVASATTDPATGPAVPDAPAVVSATVVSSSQIDLTWSAVASATGYRLQRRTAGGTFADVVIGLTGNGYQDKGLSPDTAYEYRVFAENAAGPSAPSGIASARTDPVPVAPAYTALSIDATPAGSATTVVEGSAYNVTVGGRNIYDTRDGFEFVYRQVTGDFDVRVRVASLTANAFVPKAGLMARASLTNDSANVFAYATPGSGFRVSRRATAGATTDFLKGGTPGYPNAWVRLRRVGADVFGYYSADGTNWTLLRTVTNAGLPATVYLGLATTANDSSGTVTAQYRDLGDVGGSGPNPNPEPEPEPVSIMSGLASRDINTQVAGSTSVLADGRDYDVAGSGQNIYNSTDGFRFVYKQLAGDFDLKVRVTSLTAVQPSTKAGLMARASLSLDSPNVTAHASASDGYRLSYRSTPGGATALKKAGTVTYPNAWVRLRRAGNTFTGYYSADGVNWTAIMSTTQSALPSTLYVGLCVSAISGTETATAKFRDLGSV